MPFFGPFWPLLPGLAFFRGSRLKTPPKTPKNPQKPPKNPKKVQKKCKKTPKIPLFCPFFDFQSRLKTLNSYGVFQGFRSRTPKKCKKVQKSAKKVQKKCQKRVKKGSKRGQKTSVPPVCLTPPSHPPLPPLPPLKNRRKRGVFDPPLHRRPLSVCQGGVLGG